MSSWPAIVTCLALILFAVHGIRVAQARTKYNIAAPATTGHPAFERTLRVQVNTGEQLLLFLPSLWLFSLYVSSGWGALLGLVWIGGRIAYGIAYEDDAARRHIPFAVSVTATIILLLGALIGSLGALGR